MDDATVLRAIRAYGLRPAAMLRVEKGYRNESHVVQLEDGQLVNLILYKAEPDIVQTIRNANRAAGILVRAGLPARGVLDPRLLCLRGPRQTRYACLYTYLPGSTIAWDAYTRKHLSLLGQTMGLMHRTWQDCSCDGLPEVAATYLAITDHMARYFAAAPVTAAIAAKLQLQIPLLTLQRQQGVLRAAACLPGRQPLHMDFVRSNILFTDAPPSEFGMAISGMLDFEKTALGNPVIDVARTLAFLLVDCKHKTPPAVRRAFLRSGYQKRGGGRLDTSARRLLEPLLDAFLLYDFYKFLRHNPYESLPANEHFTRTRDLLLARRIIDNSC